MEAVHIVIARRYRHCDWLALELMIYNKPAPGERDARAKDERHKLTVRTIPSTRRIHSTDMRFHNVSPPGDRDPG